MPTASRTALCSWISPPNCTGISQPANGTMRPPLSRQRSCRGVRSNGIKRRAGRAILWRSSANGSDLADLGPRLVHFQNRPYPEHSSGGFPWQAGSAAEPVSTVPEMPASRVGVGCDSLRCMPRWPTWWFVITGRLVRPSSRVLLTPQPSISTVSWSWIAPWRDRFTTGCEPFNLVS